MKEQYEEWGPWIDHDGNGVPIHVIGLTVKVEAIDNHGDLQRQIGYVDPARQDHENYRAWDWSYYAKPSINEDFGYSKIVRYRAAVSEAAE